MVSLFSIILLTGALIAVCLVLHKEMEENVLLREALRIVSRAMPLTQKEKEALKPIVELDEEAEYGKYEEKDIDTVLITTGGKHITDDEPS